MNRHMKICVGVLLVLVLTGCIGEDYDVGVPTAHLQLEMGLQNQQMQLTEANISWSSSSGDVEEAIDNIEEYGLSHEQIKVFPNQDASLEFKENEENGGDIWTDPTITAALWQNGERIDVELNEYLEFEFPTNEGNYVLEVTFANSTDRAQYVGNIVIERASEQTKTTDDKLPAFIVMEMPSIKKVYSVEVDGMVFDHSYSAICWNNCSDDSTYNYPGIHSGDVEIGDRILIDWHQMKPQPTDINLLQINTENYDVIEKVEIDITNTPLTIEVDDENMGVLYSLEFLWKEGNDMKGRSMLNFGF